MNTHRLERPSPCSSRFNLVLAATATVLAALPAHASEGMFGYTYTLDNTPARSWAYEQRHTWRSGKARGTYEAVDLRNEFEYGVTNDLQVSFYVDSLYLNQQNVPDHEDTAKYMPNNKAFNTRAVDVEILYRVLSPYRNPIGLAFYIEPELSVLDPEEGEDEIERAIEGRIILQKNFLDDTLVTAVNATFEPEWIKADGAHKKELFVEYSAGVTYRFRSNWFVGLEFRNHNEYADINFDRQAHSAFFLGPDLHYGGESYWWTLTILPQIYGWPRSFGTDATGVAVSDPNLTLGEHERFEVRVTFGIPLPANDKDTIMTRTRPEELNGKVVLK